MKLRINSLVFCLVVGVVMPVAAVEKFDLDGGHVQLGFSTEHFGSSHLGGFFTEVSGSLMFDETDITKSSVEVVAKTATLVTSANERTEAVKSPFFLDVENHPEIRFVSKKMQKNGDQLSVVGDLTIKGVTHEVSFPFVLHGPISDPFKMQRIGVEGELTINRQDYGIKFDRKMPNGKAFVGNDIKITLSSEFFSQAVAERFR